MSLPKTIYSRFDWESPLKMFGILLCVRKRYNQDWRLWKAPKLVFACHLWTKEPRASEMFFLFVFKMIRCVQNISDFVLFEDIIPQNFSLSYDDGSWGIAVSVSWLSISSSASWSLERSTSWYPRIKKEHNVYKTDLNVTRDRFYLMVKIMIFLILKIFSQSMETVLHNQSSTSHSAPTCTSTNLASFRGASSAGSLSAAHSTPLTRKCCLLELLSPDWMLGRHLMALPFYLIERRMQRSVQPLPALGS